MAIVGTLRTSLVFAAGSMLFAACGEDEGSTSGTAGSSSSASGSGASSSSSGSSSGPGSGGGGGEGATGGEGGAAGGETVGGAGGGGGTGGVPDPCGNGAIDANEDCDGANLDTMTCASFGYTNPAGLACSDTCAFDQASCSPTCDGVAAEPGEYCDGADLDNHDCTEAGYVNPDGLACNGTCDAADSSGCTAACNGTLEPTEDCDGSDLNGHDCVGFGFDNPMGLSCTSCSLDASTCTGTCDGMNIEPDEECDGALLGGYSCSTFGYADPAGLTCNQCSYDTSGCTAVCGNAVKEPGEECDGSAPNADQVCTAQCAIQFLSLHINEIYYDPPGTDVGCYIEIVGPPNTTLSGYSLKMVNGNGGTTIATIVLTGSLSATGYFVVAQDAMVIVPATANSMINGNANMQNGPDSVQLLNGTTIVDAVGYGTFGAADTFAGEGAATLGGNGVAQSVSRLPNGADTADNSVDFALGALTPGLPNAP